jgi:hypothetical protein
MWTSDFIGPKYLAGFGTVAQKPVWSMVARGSLSPFSPLFCIKSHQVEVIGRKCKPWFGKMQMRARNVFLRFYLRERKKIRWTGLGLVKKDKQLYERKLCSFFAKPQKQRCPSYFSSNT